jgi:hypothetical protein
MRTKQDAINKLLQLGKAVNQSRTNYNQLLFANQSYVKKHRRIPYPALEQNSGLHDLDQPCFTYEVDLKAFIDAYVDLCKLFNADAAEDEVLKKTALELYDEAIKSSDFNTVLMVKMIKALQESDNYRFILMGMAFSIDGFDSDFKLLKQAAFIPAGIGVLFIILGIGMLSTMSSKIEIATSLSVGIISCTLAVMIGVFGSAFLINNVAPIEAKSSEKQSITGRYGYFAHQPQAANLDEIVVSSDEEKDDFFEQDQVAVSLI